MDPLYALDVNIIELFAATATRIFIVLWCLYCDHVCFWRLWLFGVSINISVPSIIECRLCAGLKWGGLVTFKVPWSGTKTLVPRTCADALSQEEKILEHRALETLNLSWRSSPKSPSLKRIKQRRNSSLPWSFLLGPKRFGVLQNFLTSLVFVSFNPTQRSQSHTKSLIQS